MLFFRRFSICTNVVNKLIWKIILTIRKQAPSMTALVFTSRSIGTVKGERVKLAVTHSD